MVSTRLTRALGQRTAVVRFDQLVAPDAVEEWQHLQLVAVRSMLIKLHHPVVVVKWSTHMHTKTPTPVDPPITNQWPDREMHPFRDR